MDLKDKEMELRESAGVYDLTESAVATQLTHGRAKMLCDQQPVFPEQQVHHAKWKKVDLEIKAPQQ